MKDCQCAFRQKVHPKKCPVPVFTCCILVHTKLYDPSTLKSTLTCKSEVLANKRYKCKVTDDNKHNEIV